MIGILILRSGFFSPSSHAAPPLQLKPFEAEYQVQRNGIILGTLELRLTLSHATLYNYSSHTKPGPLIGWLISDEVHEISQGSYADDQIIPSSYEYRQSSGELVKKHTLVNFDWSAAKVWTESEGIRWSQPIQTGNHDKFSQQLALRLDLARGMTKASYAAADGGRIKTYYYKVVGKDHIRVPYGRVKSLRIRRSKETNPPDSTIWVAPGLDFFPVKIERKSSSGRYTMELVQLRFGE